MRRRSLPVPLLAASALALLATAALAQRGPITAVPPPAWARSVEIIDEGAIVRASAARGAPRRGTVALGTRLPIVSRVASEACATGFAVVVGTDAVVCDDLVAFSRALPGGIAQPLVPAGELLPHTYAFVAFDGTRAYVHPSDYDADQYAEAFGDGFGLALHERVRYDGLSFFRTRRGLWVESSSLRFIRGSDFRGVELAAGDALDVAWVLREGAPILARPGGRRVRRATRRDVLRLSGASRGSLELTDGTFIRAADVARATSAPPPESLRPGERWIDVDVSEQVLVAYEGERPVYATLVSTGRALPTHETPLGEFRIWVKLATSDMDDLERDDVERNYSIESVPWVQFFDGSNGFHAAFWHDDFGRRRSHGCVNLSPADARWLFEFTSPVLPDGWTAVLPADADQATLVRIR
jgi:hypothetical protein